MRVQTLGPEATVEGFNEGVIGRFARPGEVQNDVVGIGPEVEVTADKLGALVNPDCLRIAHCPTGLVERADNILRAIAEPWIDDRREPAKGVDDREHPDLPPCRELVMDKIHRPDIVRSGCRGAVIAKLRLDTSLRRLVAQLKAQLIVNPSNFLLVDPPTIALKNDLHASVAIAHTGCTDLLDPGFDAGLIGAT